MSEAAQQQTLFVDDARGLLNMFQKTLSSIGFTAAQYASSVEEAKRLLENNGIAHVISDWRMRNPNGISFLREIRRQSPDTRCTLLTGFKKDIGAAQLARLREDNIDVLDKTEIPDAVSLAELVGADYRPLFAFSADESDGHLDIHRNGNSRLPEVANSSADTILELRLQLDDTRQEISENKRLIRLLAGDLMRDLREIEGSAAGAITGDPEMSISALIYEIENQTEVGKRLIELDRSARARIRRPRPSRKTFSKIFFWRRT